MKRCVVVYFLFLSYSAIGQINFDSLWTVWNDESQADTSRLKALQKITWDGYLYSQPDSAYYFAQLYYDFAKSKGLKIEMASALNMQGLSLEFRGDYVSAFDYLTRGLSIREEIGDKRGIAASLNNLAAIYAFQGDYAKALDYYTRSLTIREAIGKREGIATSLNNIGNIYLQQADYVRAIDYYTRSLIICEEIGDKSGINACLNNIGEIHRVQGDYTSAIDYYNRSLTIREEIGDRRGVASSLNNIGATYELQDDLATAIDYHNRGLTISEEMGDIRGMSLSLLNIGIVYFKQGNYASAIDHCSRSMTIMKKIDFKLGIAVCLQCIGEIYKQQSNYATAIDYLARGLALTQEIGEVNKMSEIANALYETYKASGRQKQALEMYELYITMRDSIESEENQKEVIRQEYKYTYEKEALADSLVFAKKEAVKDLQLAKSENLKVFFIIASILTLLLAGFVFYAYRQKRKANAFLKESKERAISLFGQQVSKEVAAELLSKSFTSNSNKLLACIMFIDIRGFTPFSENKEPAEIIQYQNDVFGFMIDIISKHNGIINQFLGDGFMATFGAPSSAGNDSQNAVNAAGEIIAVLSQKCESGQIPQTKIGIGLHTGEIVTGNVGTAERKQYSITGNTVILASRIEQLNKKYNSEILISKEVLEKLDSSPANTENLGAVDLKGRAEPIEIVRLN